MFVFVLLCITLCPFWFCNHLEEEEKAGCFVIVLQMYCYYKCSVAIPHGPWVGLQYVIVVFPDHTHLLDNIFWETMTCDPSIYTMDHPN